MRRGTITMTTANASTEIEVRQNFGEVTLAVLSDPLAIFPAEGRQEVKTLTVSCSHPNYWTVESQKPEWCQVTKRSGTTFSIELADNVLQSERNTNIIVKCGTKSVSVPISQMGLNISFAELDEHIRTNLIEGLGLPAVSVAITWKERLVYAKAYGYKDRDNSDPAKWIPADNNTLYRQASNSKPITYAAICYLVDKGLLKFTDKVFGDGGILGNDFGVPSTPASPELDTRRITVKDLIQHKSGGWDNRGTYTSVVGALGDQDPIFYYQRDGGGFRTTAEIMSLVLKNFPLGATPGSREAYSNFGYCVLGRVIEKVSGQSYETFVREKLLAPCGITAMRTSKSNFAGRLENEAIFYEPNGNNWTYRYWCYEAYDYQCQDASGAWTASAIDMMRFLVHIDRNPVKPDIISEESMAISYFTNYTWAHSGSLPGTYTYICRVNDDLAFTILTTRRVDGIHTPFATNTQAIILAKTDWPDGVDYF